MSKTKLDEFSYHEALDRTHVINCMLDDHLYSHPVIKKNKKIKKKLTKAMDLLCEVYKDLGDLRFIKYADKQ